MNLQPRFALLAVVTAAALVACSDDNPPEITGENTLVNGPSFSVLDANGSDLTAVNQSNFPLPDQFPLTLFGASQNEPAMGNTGGAGEPDMGAAIGASSNSGDDFYQPETAPAVLDPLGVQMGTLLESIGSLVVAEYELATGGAVFSDDTLEISKRLAQGCDSGEIESLLNLNGTTITDGMIEFSLCERTGSRITGLMSLATTSAGSVEALVIDFDGVIVEMSTGVVRLTGLVSLQFIGDEVLLTSDSLDMSDPTTQRRWEGVAVTGRVAPDGERSLTGVTTLVNDTVASRIDFTFTDVIVPSGDDFPASGSQSQVHIDGSRVDITYGEDSLGALNFDVTGSNGSSTSFVVSDKAGVATRVPF